MAVQGIFQPHLFATGAASVPVDLGVVERRPLGRRSWLEHAGGWLPGADELFEALVERASWQQGRRRMYERTVDEPRLTSWYERSGPLPHPLLGELFAHFDQRYGRSFDSTGLNLYRDGKDSVAWHGDRVRRSRHGTVVAIVSLGEARPFLLRPRGGGRSLSFLLGGGDLLVMGGDCQHEFEHSVPKVARAGPRLSVTFRHGPMRPAPDRVSRPVARPWSDPIVAARPGSASHVRGGASPPRRALAEAGQVEGVDPERRARTRSRPSSRVAILPSSWAS
jgi:alkylated DNA repair dioxygenase AlkB